MLTKVIILFCTIVLFTSQTKHTGTLNGRVFIEATGKPVKVIVKKESVTVKLDHAEMDGSSEIFFFAVSTSNPELADHYLSVATTALVAGRNLKLRFWEGDTTGTEFYCNKDVCRRIWQITLY